MESYPHLELQLLARIFAGPLDQTLREQIPELELPPRPWLASSPGSLLVRGLA